MCEDFPCCGHEPGCCTDKDENGAQTNMVCICGARLPLTSVSSLCQACLSYTQTEEDSYGLDGIGSNLGF